MGGIKVINIEISQQGRINIELLVCRMTVGIVLINTPCFSLVPRPLPRSLRVTLKTWEWPGDEATLLIYNEHHWCQTLGAVRFIEIVVT